MILNIIATVVIPFIIQALKRLKLPSKWAPVVAVVLAVIYVVIAKVANLPVGEIQSIYDAILLALGISGTSVLGYDILKKFTEVEK